STLGLVFRIETEMDQRIVALARFHPDVAALAAIAARRPAARNVLLPPERHAAVAAIASLHSNFGFIDEHDVWRGRPRPQKLSPQKNSVGTDALVRPAERSSAVRRNEKASTR